MYYYKVKEQEKYKDFFNYIKKVYFIKDNLRV